MTELIRTILLRVTLAGLASAVALSIVKESALREVVRLAAGLLMLLALLQPLSRFRLPSAAELLSTPQADTSELTQQNVQTAMDAVGSSIGKTLEQRAAAEGFDCSVLVTMAADQDGVLQIEQITVRYKASDSGRLEELQELLTTECGVPKEKQELIAR